MSYLKRPPTEKLGGLTKSPRPRGYAQGVRNEVNDMDNNNVANNQNNNEQNVNVEQPVQNTAQDAVNDVQQQVRHDAQEHDEEQNVEAVQNKAAEQQNDNNADEVQEFQQQYYQALKEHQRVRRDRVTKKSIVALAAGASLVAAFALGYAVHRPVVQPQVVALNQCLAEHALPMFDDTLGSQWMLPFQQVERIDNELLADLPRVTTRDMPKSVVITAANLPAARPQNLKVRVEGRALVVNAEQDKDQKLNAGKQAQQQRSVLSFEARVPLPANVQADKMQTNFKDGVLTVTLPKT